MKLKDQLILREVAGQYVIVPTGKRVTEVTSIVYISLIFSFIIYARRCTFFPLYIFSFLDYIRTHGQFTSICMITGYFSLYGTVFP